MKPFLLFLIFIACIPTITAMGIQGVVLKDTLFFQPGMERHYDLTFSTNSGFTEDYVLYAHMLLGEQSPVDLTSYVTIDKYYVKEVPTGSVIPFTVDLKLPETIDVPGIHEIRAGARETGTVGGGGMGALTAAELRIIVIVLFPGEYGVGGFITTSVNENQTLPFKFTISNYGTSILQAKGRVGIYKEGESLLLGVARSDTYQVNSTGSREFFAFFNTTGLSPGDYYALGTLIWSKNNETQYNATFSIGSKSAFIVDYTKEAYVDTVNKMEFIVRSLWNNKINNIYVDAFLLDKNNKTIASFPTTSKQLSPWQTDTVLGYLDTKNVPEGNYTLRMRLNYDTSQTTFEGNISILPKPPAETPQPEVKKEHASLPRYVSIMFIIIGALLIMLLILVFIIIKRR
jgi:hypothetical protein